MQDTFFLLSSEVGVLMMVFVILAEHADRWLEKEDEPLR